MKRLACFVLSGLVASLVATACAQNLIANGDFDTDLSGWATPEGTPMWSNFDVDGSSTSGSVWFANMQADANVRQVVISQCIPIVQTGTYVFGGAAYAPTGQVSAGRLYGEYAIDVRHADCSGGYSSLGGLSMTSLGQWTYYATTGGLYRPLSVPVLFPEASILIRFSVEKTDAGGSFGGYFDGAYVIRDTLLSEDFDIDT
ncbi:MAG: hypothetical protein NVV68_18325 [Dokdonella sp.]|jgi:hypothetical protein|nr:hypothetical protein [Dokdonella sp.]